MKITNPPIPPLLKGGKGGLKPIFGLNNAGIALHIKPHENSPIYALYLLNNESIFSAFFFFIVPFSIATLTVYFPSSEYSFTISGL